MLIEYARVSTVDQNLALQRDALTVMRMYAAALPPGAALMHALAALGTRSSLPLVCYV
jgi:hypothetical protein